GRECRRRRGRKSQADTQSLAIVKRERCLDATELTLLECFAVPPPEPEQQSFNVLTGPQRIDREIGAGAIVLEQPWAAQGNPVGLVAGGAYLVIAINIGVGPGQNPCNRPLGTLAAGGNFLLN